MACSSNAADGWAMRLLPTRYAAPLLPSCAPPSGRFHPGTRFRLIGASEYHAAGRGLTGHHALPLLRRAVERNAPDRRRGFLLNLVLGLARAVPMRLQEPALLDLGLELVVTVHRPRRIVAELARLVEQALLNLLHPV